MNLKQQATQELAKRELERRYALQRTDLIEFIKYFFKQEKGKEFDDNWHYKLIADALYRVMKGECTRLMINQPPGSGKTELITKCFPVWYMGNKPEVNICATGYSTALTQTYSAEARDYYKSQSFKRVFPRRPDLREDQDTKENWQNQANGSYYATGTGGSITGRRFHLVIIDDSLKPDEADSDLKRIGVNNWYSNTVLSRLYDPMKDAVIIIQQRTHENDLCGYLLEKEANGSGEKWEKIVLPAIAEKDEPPYRQVGQALQENRYPLESLEKLKQSLGNVNFSCQYQQNPIAKESQEFHEEWFKYYESAPAHGRTFTTVDPAFTKKTSSDYTAIVTGKFVDDKLYILEYTNARLDPAELEDKIIYHVRKWAPEKVGVESFQAQALIAFSLKNRIQREGLHVGVEEIKQTGEKGTKIRRLVPLYRNGQIYHKTGMVDLEDQLVKFPRGSHDDLIDSEQMLYSMYEMQPNVKHMYTRPQFSFDRFGKPHMT